MASAAGAIVGEFRGVIKSAVTIEGARLQISSPPTMPAACGSDAMPYPRPSSVAPREAGGPWIACPAWRFGTRESFGSPVQRGASGTGLSLPWRLNFEFVAPEARIW
jgi:hypothetical protein